MSRDVSDNRPVVGISMGDPSGIGPEVVVKSIADPALQKRARFVIYGANAPLTLAADHAGIDPFWYRIPSDSNRLSSPIDEPVIVRDHVDFGDLLRLPASPTPQGGAASKQFVEEALADALEEPDSTRRIDAMVTAPISKTAWHMAGFNWPGHTELVAHRTRCRRCCMMFEAPRLKVVLATVHLPLMDIRNSLTIGRVFDPIDLGHQACLTLGIEEPRIAVCGLNPHAGEGGLLGDEETRIIQPAIDMACRAGIKASGPWPADTIFADALDGRYDLVVAMYHDQGLIPLKLIERGHAANWTIGPPIIRTSPDHGTAYGIAGTNKADAGSMKAAIDLAIRLATNRRDKASLPNGSNQHTS
ncbi:MAG: 4-hydroxythreonine-4-phosphate dehydrogenase PdxA [Phycisphaerae bacterium]|nr:4-hydroxythreonine-4-phosphate dehydrogenase PdxA [Phycisphaerae bacterium]|tara:strand:+ start:2259 stop:3335 length:1077 start_codon:yes stop_codon:yes gene_type:complete